MFNKESFWVGEHLKVLGRKALCLQRALNSGPFSNAYPYAPLPFGCSWVIYFIINHYVGQRTKATTTSARSMDKKIVFQSILTDTLLFDCQSRPHPIGNSFYHSKATVHLDFTGKTKVNFMGKTFACLPGVHHHILSIFLITINRKKSIPFETFISMDVMPRMQTCMIKGWQISLTSKLLFLTGPWKTKTTFLLSMLLPYYASYKKYMTPEVPLEFPSEPWNTPRRNEPPWMRLTFPANTGSTLNSKTCFQVFF